MAGSQNSSAAFKDPKPSPINPDNKAKLTKMINGTLKSFLQAQSAVMKMVSMRQFPYENFFNIC